MQMNCIFVVCINSQIDIDFSARFAEKFDLKINFKSSSINVFDEKSFT